MRYVAVVTAVMLAAARVAEAHPGHGPGGGSWAVGHYVSEPLHLGTAAALAALAAAVLAWRWQDGRRARPAPARRPDRYNPAAL